jgi:hypothetical protein
MDDSQNEAQLMGTGSDHGTFVLLNSFRNWGLCWCRNGNNTLNTDWDAWLREWWDVFRNCTGYEAVRLVMDDSQNEAQLMGTRSDHCTFVLLKSHKGHTSQAYSLGTGKPLKTTPREDRLLKRLARHQPFSTANTLWSRWIVNGRISRRTVNRRLNNARFRARRPIKRPREIPYLF